jgi:sugar-specific transcriptional regulator TrmB
MDTAILQEYGLTPNEITIYVTALKLGRTSATRLSQRANLPRPTVYDVAQSLIEKGLLSVSQKDNVRNFEAADPQKFISNLEERKAKIKKILPELQALTQTFSTKPQLRLFEGIEGVKIVFDDLIATGKPIQTLSSTKDLLEKLVYHFPRYIEERVKAKIPIQVLTEKTPQSVKWAKNGKKEFREVRFVPKSKAFPNAMFFYGEKIAFVNMNNDPVGIIIENKDLRNTFQIVFDLLWDSAKKL